MPVSQHSGATQIRLASIQEICIVFSSLQKKDRRIGGGCVQIARITYFYSSGSFVFTKQKVNDTDYHYYSPAPSGVMGN
jgi:hypothetical protein